MVESHYREQPGRVRRSFWLCNTVNVRNGSSTDLTAPKSNFRSSPESGLKSDIAPCPKRANFGPTPKEGSVPPRVSAEGPLRVNRVGLSMDQRRPVHPCKQTVPESVRTSR